MTDLFIVALAPILMGMLLWLGLGSSDAVEPAKAKKRWHPY
jgi:hypothetical protein